MMNMKWFWQGWCAVSMVLMCIQFFKSDPDLILIALAMGGAFGGYFMSTLDNEDPCP